MQNKEKSPSITSSGQLPRSRFAGLSALVTAALVSSTLGATAQAQNSGSTMLEEVFVTAQKREESLQEVPVSISVLDTGTLEAARIQYSSDIVYYSPNLSVENRLKQGYTNYFMRGIGASDDSLASNPSIGFLVDGLFANSAGANVTSVLDVEQVEIIRGPQGTMFGRNTIGGVINIISKKPQDEFSAKLSGGYGNYGRVDVAGSATGPLIPGLLSGSIGLAYSEHDAYVENLFPGGNDAEEEQDHTARVALRLTPTDTFEAVLSVDYSSLEGSHYGSDAVGTGPLGYTDSDGDIRKVSFDEQHEVESKNWGASATLTWQLEAGELKWLSGYRYTELDSLWVDYDATPEDLIYQFGPQEEDSFSTELQFAFDVGERTSWIVGAYYLNYEGYFDNGIMALGYLREFVGPGVIPVYRREINAETKSWSVFANVDIDLTDRLSLALGGRYSDSKKDIFYIQELEFGPNDYRGAFTRGEVPDNVAVVPLGAALDVDDSWSRFNPRAALTFQKTDDLMLFASIAQGHRDGGFDLSGTAADSAYDEEILIAYELGVKSTLFDGSARFNVTAFFYDYEDIQVTDIVTLDEDPPRLVRRVRNAAAAESYGLEAELLANLTPDLFVTATLGLLHTEFTKGNSEGEPAPGNEFPFAPDVTFTLIPEYTMAALDTGDIVLRGEWLFRSREFHQFDNLSNEAGDSRSVFNASINFASNDGSWQLSLWGKNVFDKDYIIASQNLESIAPIISYNYGDPRTYGVSFAYNFR